MEIVFCQSAQDCGSAEVSLCDGYKKLAGVGIGESQRVVIEDERRKLTVRCGVFSVDVDVDSSCVIEASWSLVRRSMIVSKNKRVVGEMNQ